MASRIGPVKFLGKIVKIREGQADIFCEEAWKMWKKHVSYVGSVTRELAAERGDFIRFGIELGEDGNPVVSRPCWKVNPRGDPLDDPLGISVDAANYIKCESLRGADALEKLKREIEDRNCRGIVRKMPVSAASPDMESEPDDAESESDVHATLQTQPLASIQTFAPSPPPQARVIVDCLKGRLGDSLKPGFAESIPDGVDPILLQQYEALTKHEPTHTELKFVLPAGHRNEMEGRCGSFISEIEKQCDVTIVLRDNPENDHVTFRIRGPPARAFLAHSLMMVRFHEVDRALGRALDSYDSADNSSEVADGFGHKRTLDAAGSSDAAPSDAVSSPVSYERIVPQRKRHRNGKSW